MTAATDGRRDVRDSVPPGAPAPLPRNRSPRPQFIAYLYMAPAVLLVGGLVLFPVFRVIGFSLYEWSGAGAATWVGLENYASMLRDPVLHRSILNALAFVVTYSFLPIVIGLVVAGIIGRYQLHAIPFFRTVLFLPQVTTVVAVGVAWRWMYSENGTINSLLSLIGIDAGTAWLGDFTWALPAVGLIGTWVMFGFCMILFLAGMAKIDRALYDAARVDGAGAVREFMTVSLPGLRPELTVAVVVTIIGALQTFALVYVTTAGGPGHATVVPGFLVYRMAFRAGDVGGASAVAVALTAVVFLVAIGLARLLREKD